MVNPENKKKSNKNILPLILVILDGWGLAKPNKGNAIALAKTPTMDGLMKKYPGVKKMLVDDRGKLHSYVGIYINSQDAFPDELTKPIKDGDELTLCRLGLTFRLPTPASS